MTEFKPPSPLPFVVYALLVGIFILISIMAAVSDELGGVNRLYFLIGIVIILTSIPLVAFEIKKIKNMSAIRSIKKTNEQSFVGTVETGLDFFTPNDIVTEIIVLDIINEVWFALSSVEYTK